MYPDLSYILADVFGTPVDNFFSLIKTFGLVLVFAFLGSAYILRSELRRKETQGLLMPLTIKVREDRLSIGDILSNAFFIFILAYKLPYIVSHIKELKADAASVILSMQGHLMTGLIAAGVVIAWMLFKQYISAKNTQLITKVIRPADRVPDITMISAFFGILGAKLFVIIESKESFNAFMKDPIDQLFSGSGLAIYGGLIVAFIAVIVYVKRIGLKPIHIMDAAAPALLIGYAIGRIGCQMSGDGDWGIVNALAQPTWWFLPDWVWAFDYPNTVVEYINPASGNHIVDISDCSGYVTASGEQPHYCGKLANAVFPTPIYETVLSLVIFVILWSLRKRIAIPGMIFFMYCAFNGFERFWIEKIRVNEKLDVFGLQATQAEIISTLLFIIGIVGCAYLWKTRERGSAIVP